LETMDRCGQLAFDRIMSEDQTGELLEAAK
jgi:hypothetical protein